MAPHQKDFPLGCSRIYSHNFQCLIEMSFSQIPRCIQNQKILKYIYNGKVYQPHLFKCVKKFAQNCLIHGENQSNSFLKMTFLKVSKLKEQVSQIDFANIHCTVAIFLLITSSYHYFSVYLLKNGFFLLLPVLLQAQLCLDESDKCLQTCYHNKMLQVLLKLCTRYVLCWY